MQQPRSHERPGALAPGARVHLFAPSSGFDRARFDAGHALLAARYRVSQGASVFAREGFLAGSDAARLADVVTGLADPEARALIAARGGYGATRLLPHLDVARVREAGKWLVGFSDVTALHAVWARAGLCSLHAPMVCSLPDADPPVRAAWHALLEGGPPAPLTDLTVVHPGRAEGRLFGGNLTVLAALAGTPYFPPLDDVVLVLEDVGERPYRLDRVLTMLLQTGLLTGVRAVVLGGFTEAAPGADGVRAEDVLAERLKQLGVPVLADAPFGHVRNNCPLLLGAWARVDTAARRVDFAA
ncbi:MAG: LD-carboxypeptidase [Polyangiales bacterium]